MTFKCPDKYRIVHPQFGWGDECNGIFSIPLKHGQKVFVQASNGAGREHVSVSRKDRPPLWDEMCQIKSMFWGADDCVVQYHPPESDYVNNHPNCLHLWRPIGVELPRPERLLV